MKKIFLFYSVFLLVILSSGCSVTNVREHPTLEKQLLDVDSILVITPAVTIHQINFASDNERLLELESKIKEELVSYAKMELKKKGYIVIEFDLESAITEDDQLAYAVNQAREGFEEAKKILYETALSEDEKRKYKTSIGTAVNLVSEKSGADAILLLHFIGQKKSGGSIAKDVVISSILGALTGAMLIPSSESSYIEAAFIDGITGEVLWSNIISTAQLSINAENSVLTAFPKDIDTEAEIAALETVIKVASEQEDEYF